MNDIDHLFTGKAGAVASQFLIRNWTVAFPALDLGVDLLIAIRDHRSRFAVRSPRARWVASAPSS